MARRRGYRRKSGGGFGLGGGMNKWLKVGLFSLAGLYLAPKLGINGQLGAGAAGFFAGGPIGGVAGYLGAPMLAGVVGGATGGSNAFNQA